MGEARRRKLSGQTAPRGPQSNHTKTHGELRRQTFLRNTALVLKQGFRLPLRIFNADQRPQSHR